MTKEKSASHKPVTSRIATKKRFTFAPVPSPGTATLGTLPAVFGPADEAARSLFFRDVDDSVLVDDGTKVETSTILNSVPTFLVSCANILGALSAEQEALLYLDPAIFGVLVSETEKLVAQKKIHDDAVRAEKSGHLAKEETTSSVTRDAARLRDRTRAGLISALGNSRRSVIDTAAGTSTEDPTLLATALDAVARLLDDVHDPKSGTWTANDRTAIERFGIDGAHAAMLRAAAQDVRAAGDVAAKPTRSATQRALDLQDGRVLLLIEVIVRAFRQAHRENAAIALPDLKQIAWKFTSRSGKRPKKTTAPATPIEADPLQAAQAELAAANKAVVDATAKVTALQQKTTP